MLEKKSTSESVIKRELRKIVETTAYVVAYILSSLLITAAFMLSIFVLSKLALFLFGSIPPLIDTLLEFSLLEGLIIFSIVFVSSITIMPKVLKRIHEEKERKGQS